MRIRKKTNHVHKEGGILLKRFLYYFIWTLAVGFILYGGMQLQLKLAERAQMLFDPFPLQLFIALFPVAIGLLIRIPKLLLQIKENRVWKFDWILFAAVGLPSLYLVLMTFLPFSSIGEGRLPVHLFLYVNGSTVTTIAGLVFGYVLLESFKDRKSTEEV